MNPLRSIAVVLACACALGCGPRVVMSENIEQVFATDESSFQSSDVCPGAAKKLTGTFQPGTPCSSWSDCAPVCCPCSGERNNSWLAAVCQDDVCANETDACADTTGGFVDCSE